MLVTAVGNVYKLWKKLEQNLGGQVALGKVILRLKIVVSIYI